MPNIEPTAGSARVRQRRVLALAVGATVLVLASTGLIESIASTMPSRLADLWTRLSGWIATLHFQPTEISGVAGTVFLFATVIIALLLLSGRRDRSRLVVRLARRGRPMPALARRTGWSQDAVRTLIRLEGYERDKRYASGKFFRVLGNSRLSDRFAAWAGRDVTGCETAD